MEIQPTEIPDVVLIKPKAHRDARGFFIESWQQNRYLNFKIPDSPWVQDNVSCSSQGVLRGLHFQTPRSQGKLITVLEGAIFDVAVDIRTGSPTFGRWVSATLSSDNLHQFWVPKGFAHGFLVLSDRAIVSYKASELYYPEDEHSVLWNDPDIGIAWPLTQTPQLSQKDNQGKRLRDFTPSELPAYHR